MKKIFGTALAAGAAMLGTTALPTGVAHAEDVAWTGNIAFTSDYVFRGISQSSEGPAVQGGFDGSYGGLYFGTWASSLGQGASPSLEVDVYGGWKPTVGPFALDLGVIGYFYPDAQDQSAELDYFEAKAAATINPAENWGITGSVFWSPENYAETGAAFYVELASSFAFSDELSVSGALGLQSIDDVNGPPGAEVDDDYTTWNLGATYNISGFGLDLRYIDTTIANNDPIRTSGYTTIDNSDERVVLTIKRAL